MSREKLIKVAVGGALIGAGIAATFTADGRQDVQGGCTADIYKTDIVGAFGQGGITLPKTPKGDTIILMDAQENRITRAHELGHAEQYCEEGAIPFITNYVKDPQKYERDADKRAARK